MADRNLTIDLSDLLANLRDRGHGNCPHDDQADGPEEDCRACLSDCAVAVIESIADANAALQGVAQQATSLYKDIESDLAAAIGERDFWKAQHDDKQTALEMAEAKLEQMRERRRPIRPADTLAVQWLNTDESLAAIKAMDTENEIVFAADGTPALEIESPGRDVERVDLGDYVARRVVGGLMAMKADVYDQAQQQIAEMGEPIGRLVYEDGGRR